MYEDMIIRAVCSTAPRAIEEAASQAKSGLWKGRAKPASAMAVDFAVAPEKKPVDNSELQDFATQNPGAFLSFCKSAVPGKRPKKRKKIKAEDSFADVADIAVEAMPAEATVQEQLTKDRLKCPLQSRRGAL